MACLMVTGSHDGGTTPNKSTVNYYVVNFISEQFTLR